MGTLTITLIKSAHGRLPSQDATLKALRLKKINTSVVKPDNKAIRGMIARIGHLVTVKENV